jgi:hypothetical protein
LKRAVELKRHRYIEEMWVPEGFTKFERRTVFTPSYGRKERPFLYKKPVADTTFCVVVNYHDEEKEDYKRVWACVCPVIVLAQTVPPGIGAARCAIVNIAVAWKLSTVWMMDDGVHPDLFEKEEKMPDETLVMKKVEMSVVFDDFEKCMEKFNMALMSPTSVFSRKGLRPERGRIANHRAPTGCVLLNVKACAEAGLNYERELLHKEDIMFAFACLKKDLRIGIHRGYTLQVSLLSSGGCPASALANPHIMP